MRDFISTGTNRRCCAPSAKERACAANRPPELAPAPCFSMLAADMGGDLCFRSRFFRRNKLPPPLSPSTLRVHARPTHLLDETNVIADLRFISAN